MSLDSSLGPIVFVVDDHVSVRESLESLIRHKGWEPALFSFAQAFLNYPRGTAPGCLLLDVSLPDLNGRELQKSVLGDQPILSIIFITGSGDVPTTDLGRRLALYFRAGTALCNTIVQ